MVKYLCIQEAEERLPRSIPDYKPRLQQEGRGEECPARNLLGPPRYLRNFEVWVVTKDDVDKEFLNRLARLDDRVKVI